MKTNKNNFAENGFTLLEVLIAIVVLSFGLLALLGLIISGLKMTSSSNYRTIAAEQLTSMADMINSNPYLVSSYASLSKTSTITCLKSAGCSTTDLPNNDYFVWQSRLADLLPNGKGIVCLDSTPSDGNSSNFACDASGRPTVKICWNENSRIKVSGGGTSGTDSSTDTCLSSQL